MILLQIQLTRMLSNRMRTVSKDLPTEESACPMAL